LGTVALLLRGKLLIRARDRIHVGLFSRGTKRAMGDTLAVAVFLRCRGLDRWPLWTTL